MQYLFQSINFRGDASSKPYKDLLQGVGTEEISHVELIGTTIARLLDGSAAYQGNKTDPLDEPGQRGPRRSRSPWIPATSTTTWLARRAPCRSMRRETRGAARMSTTAATSCSTCFTT
jgi:hypothetical protein